MIKPKHLLLDINKRKFIGEVLYENQRKTIGSKLECKVQINDNVSLVHCSSPTIVMLYGITESYESGGMSLLLRENKKLFSSSKPVSSAVLTSDDNPVLISIYGNIMSILLFQCKNSYHRIYWNVEWRESVSHVFYDEQCNRLLLVADAKIYGISLDCRQDNHIRKILKVDIIYHHQHDLKYYNIDKFGGLVLASQKIALACGRRLVFS
jgi:hypothetical protein